MSLLCDARGISMAVGYFAATGSQFQISPQRPFNSWRLKAVHSHHFYIALPRPCAQAQRHTPSHWRAMIHDRQMAAPTCGYPGIVQTTLIEQNHLEVTKRIGEQLMSKLCSHSQKIAEARTAR